VPFFLDHCDLRSKSLLVHFSYWLESKSLTMHLSYDPLFKKPDLVVGTWLHLNGFPFSLALGIIAEAESFKSKINSYDYAESCLSEMNRTGRSQRHSIRQCLRPFGKGTKSWNLTAAIRAWTHGIIGSEKS